jgi:hypothetical protein
MFGMRVGPCSHSRNTDRTLGLGDSSIAISRWSMSASSIRIPQLRIPSRLARATLTILLQFSVQSNGKLFLLTFQVTIRSAGVLVQYRPRSHRQVQLGINTVSCFLFYGCNIFLELYQFSLEVQDVASTELLESTEDEGFMVWVLRNEIRQGGIAVMLFRSPEASILRRHGVAEAHVSRKSARRRITLLGLARLLDRACQRA